MAKIKITETVLRDAHQSLFATRMTTAEMLPIIEQLDNIGYHSLECWGGATFDSCLRFLNEDPWERLRKIKEKAPNTPLQMLLRGQNILGYKHYPDDVVEYFVQKAIYNGIDIIRIFDALNDPRNLETAMKATKKEGGHAQGTICYTISDVHTTEQYLKDARGLVDAGADSICIKDMAGLLLPYKAYELITALKEEIKIPIQLHTHATSGTANMTYIKAIEAGIDIVDTAISPLSMGTAQPATEPLVMALQGTKYDTGLDVNSLNDIADYFRPIRQKYIDNGLYNTKSMGVNIKTLLYQVPGGMLSNLINQLKQAGKEELYEAVLEEVPKVRADFGFPPLVTPSSQIVGTQAVMNVIAGERYKMVPNETKDLVAGRYGTTPVPIKQEFVEKILGKGVKSITHRPADDLEPGLDKFKNEMKEFLEQDEDVLSYAVFPKVAMKYFEYRRTQKYNIDQDMVDMENKVHPV